MTVTTTANIHMPPATNAPPNSVSTSSAAGQGHKNAKHASQSQQSPTTPQSAHTVADAGTSPLAPSSSASATQSTSSSSRRCPHISIATWIGVLLALAVASAGIYYSEYTKRMARWTASNDFRGSCLSYLENGLALSSACNETLAKPPTRPPAVKRAESEPRGERRTEALLWALMCAIPVISFIFFKVMMRGFVETRPKPVVSKARTSCNLGQNTDQGHVVWGEMLEELKAGEQDIRTALDELVNDEQKVPFGGDSEEALPNIKAGSPAARRVILSLDGGGVRSFSSLLILRRLMEMIKEIERAEVSSHQNSAEDRWSGKEFDAPDEEFLMDHYVDYFFGTSSGALIAIMLGRLKMSIDAALQHHGHIGEMVFQYPKTLTKGKLKLFNRTRFSEKRMEKALKDATAPRAATRHYSKKDQERLVNAAAEMQLMRDHDQKSARTAVVAHCAGLTVPYLFRSYDHPVPDPGLRASEKGFHLNYAPASTVPLWQAARATSAAPGFCPPMQIGDSEFQDGALAGCNNPVVVAYNEVKQLHPSDEPMVIVSIGTGGRQSKEIDRGKFTASTFYSNARIVKDQIFNADRTHRDFVAEHELQQHDDRDVHNPKAIYFRFDVPPEPSLAAVDLGDWKGLRGVVTRDAIRNPTDRYLGKDDTTKELQRCARILVDIRRRRSGTARWEAFADDMERRGMPNVLRADL